MHSGRGSNTAHHVYAGWNHVWNNTGDTATLGDVAGSTVDRCGWSGGTGTTTC